MDQTTTPFGGRLFRQWLCRPLIDSTAINARQDAVHEVAALEETALAPILSELAVCHANVIASDCHAIVW
jgi:DNA mismatch repair ATPase MutS